MPFQRGDIVEYDFPMPDSNKSLPHPAVILSDKSVYYADDCYLCVMLTTSTEIDRFTFIIEDDMLIKKNSKPFSQARAHLVSYVRAKAIVTKMPFNRMKEAAVNRLAEHIKVVAFSPLDED